MTDIDDWAWKVIRSCGLSTADANINVFALHHDIREMLKPRELTDGEILNIYLEQTNGNEDLDIIEFAKEILKKASEK
jgi:hypothetical protein